MRRPDSIRPGDDLLHLYADRADLDKLSRDPDGFVSDLVSLLTADARLAAEMETCRAAWRRDLLKAGYEARVCARPDCGELFLDRLGGRTRKYHHRNCRQQDHRATQRATA